MPRKINNMRIILFALTGFGNKVLDKLLEESCEVKAIFTRKEKGPFPYYSEENLASYAAKKQITVYDDFDWEQVEKIIKKANPDLILVATFHKIIPQKIISLTPLAVNLHPSLLPKYKGATPVTQVLNNQERKTGITVHLLTEEVDSGDILIQKEIGIEKKDNEGSLRKKLAFSAAETTQELIMLIKNNSLKATPQPDL